MSPNGGANKKRHRDCLDSPQCPTLASVVPCKRNYREKCFGVKWARNAYDSSFAAQANNCAQLCITSADFMLRGSEYHPRVCVLCAKVCGRCAESCAQFDNDAPMQECTEKCRACAASCREMAGMTMAM